ncbi:MAG: hypothetical protein SH848_06195 [Saprospiraceae bacterium]|nr:hypothetical protein [Saprospiraceae bacterium]
MSSKIKKANTLPEIYRSLTPSTFLTQEEREFYTKIYDEELKGKFEERLEGTRQQLEGELKVERETQKSHQANAGAKAEVGFGENPILKFLSIFQIKGGFFADYKFNYDKRQIVREVLTPRRDDLLRLLNELIENYRIKNKGKQVLLIFHELNHMQNPDAIEKLFVNDRYYLEGIRAKKVVTIPVALVPITEFNQEELDEALKYHHSAFEIYHQLNHAEGIQKMEDNIQSLEIAKINTLAA